MSNETNDARNGDERPAEPKRGPKKSIVVAAVVVVVLVAAGAGLWTWHEQPSFCGAVCHTPMDGYLATFEADPTASAVDKWGNEVADASSMLSATHASLGKACLDCHEPTLEEQMGEGMSWATGGYAFPLDERATEDLTKATGKARDEFCLNESCHNLTRDDLVELTADRGVYNPHLEHHEELDCGTCHKAHRASVLYCSQCHASAEVPEGWLSADEANKLTEID